MPLSRVILLAAGQGSRLGDLTRSCPKSLLPIAGERLLVRTVRQLADRGFSDLTIVVGHQREAVQRALAPWAASGRARFVHNANYAQDTNIGSLLLGLAGSDESALIIEADIAFDDVAMDALATAAAGADSVWFTRGPFLDWQLGGILRADGAGRLTDLRYVPAYAPEFDGYKKLIGVTYAGSREMPGFHARLRAAARQSTAQYYMMPWCRHLAELPARECDLAHCRAAAFNTPEEYHRCLELFVNQREEIHAR